MKAVLPVVCFAASLLASVRCRADETDLILGDFEGKDFAGWKTTGDAFGSAPFRPRADGRLKGGVGEGIAWSGRAGEDRQGELLSPEFKIERTYVNFLVAGQRDLPSRLGVELLLGGRVARASSATEYFGTDMAWRTWDVGEFAGRTAQVRVNDHSASGSIAVDEFRQSDTAKSVPADARTLFEETLRPQFHFTAKTGWMNDANGLLHYDGQWHLFHQHRPPGSSSIVWGHAVSADLLHWRHLPTAIANDGSETHASGSGLVDWENASGLKRGSDPPILLFYTLHSADAGRKLTQCLAFSTDGAQTFDQFPGNPILRTPDSRDRDPKVFFHKPTRAWFMVLSLSRNNTDREHATYGLFRSRDLRSWELLQEIGPGPWYWECPDMFELPVTGGPLPNRTKWLLVKGSGDYIVGTFDGNRFTCETEPIRIHWHNCYYGAQSFSDAPGGRRVQIGWMNSGSKTEAPNAFPGMPFNQQMSFPRELRLCSTPEGPRLFRQPVAEIAQLYARTYDLGASTLAPGGNALAGFAPGLLDIQCEIDLEQASRLSLKCRGAELSFDVKSGKLRLLRADPTLTLKYGRLVLRVLIDRTSIEAFANRGEVDVTGVYFPDPADQTLTLSVEGGPAKVRRLVVHQLHSIWPSSNSE